MQPSSNGPWSSPADHSSFQLPQEDFFSTPQNPSTFSRSQNQHFRFSAYDQPENLLANATHEQLLVNSVYSQLWHSHAILKAKYDGLQTNYTTLATSIPQIFSIIPNPYSVAVPVSAISTTARDLVPSTKPEKIKYWRRSDYNARMATRGDLTYSNDDSGTDSDEEKPKKKKKAKSGNVLAFLENEDGTPFNDDRISFVRSTAYKSFNSLLNAGLAPNNWRDCSLEITNRFRGEMIAAIPALALGENYWKVDAVGTEVYAQWKRKHLPAAARGKDESEHALKKGKGKEVILDKRKRRGDDHRSGYKRRHIEESAAPLDMEVVLLDDPHSPSPPPVEILPVLPSPPSNTPMPHSTDPTPETEILQDSEEPVLPSPPPDTPMPHSTDPTPETEREPLAMVELRNPLSQFFVEPPPKPVLPPTHSSSKRTPTANTVVSTSKDASSKPKGATYFIPTATLTGYNLFGKSFTDDGKKKIPREQVKAEYQKPEIKQHWDKIAKQRKAEEKSKVEAAAAPAESEQA